MASLVDHGVTRTWPRRLDVAWVVVMIAIGMISTGFIAQALRTMMGQPEIAWFPNRAALRGKSGLVALLLVAGVVLTGVLVVSLIWPALRERAALAGAGVLILSLVFLRSRGFWEAPEISALRDLFGNPIIALLYAAIGIGLIVLALVAP